MEESICDSINPDRVDCFEKSISVGNMNTDDRVYNDERSFLCHICERRFTNSSNLNRHIRLHTGEKPFECDVCKKIFSLKCNLETHMRIHTGEKPYECNICKRNYSRKNNLERHIKTHTGEKPHECNICQKRFSMKSHLKYHMRIHTGEKPHECDICRKKFSREDNLKTHMRSHTGEKPYDCSICRRKFSQKSALNSHMRNHTGEKPYECDICEKRFSQHINLKSHRTIHTGRKPFECDICKKQFSLQGNLKTHLRIHTGEKPFGCYICKKKFTQETHLKTHMRIHTGEKPHKCDICNKKFSQEGHMRSHRRTHTGEEPFESEDSVIVPSASVENSEDVYLESDEKDIFCNSEEVSDSFDSDSWSHHGGESQDKGLGESVCVVSDVDLCYSADGSSHLMVNDLGMGSKDGSSLESRTENVSPGSQEKLCPMVDGVLDTADTKIKIENDDSHSNAYVSLKQQNQIPLRDDELECRKMKPVKGKVSRNIRYEKTDGYIDQRKKEMGCSIRNMVESTSLKDDNHRVFDIHRVYVVETNLGENSDTGERKDFQCDQSDVLIMPKKENDESLSSMQIKEEPDFYKVECIESNEHFRCSDDDDDDDNGKNNDIE